MTKNYINELLHLFINKNIVFLQGEIIVEIKDYELINDKYKITYSDGEVIYIPRKIFERTYTYLGLELNKAITELFKQFCKSVGIYKICKILNLPIKEKYKF